MNKKGFFFSLTAILIVIVMGVYFFSSETVKTKDNVIELQYMKHSQVIDYIENFRENNLPAYIKMSAKLSFQGISSKVNRSVLDPSRVTLPDNITLAINSGSTDGSGNPVTNVTNYTLNHFVGKTKQIMPVEFNFENFEFEVISVKHLTPKILEINSTVDIRLNVSDNSTVYSKITWEDEINYSHNISLVGFVDPDAHETITGLWHTNSSKDCFLRQMDDSYICHVDGLSP